MNTKFPIECMNACHHVVWNISPKVCPMCFGSQLRLFIGIKVATQKTFDAFNTNHVLSFRFPRQRVQSGGGGVSSSSSSFEGLSPPFFGLPCWWNRELSSRRPRIASAGGYFFAESGRGAKLDDGVAYVSKAGLKLFFSIRGTPPPPHQSILVKCQCTTLSSTIFTLWLRKREESSKHIHSFADDAQNRRWGKLNGKKQS